MQVCISIGITILFNINMNMLSGVRRSIHANTSIRNVIFVSAVAPWLQSRTCVDQQVVNEWSVNAHRNFLATSVPDNCDLFWLGYSSSSPLCSYSLRVSGACILSTWCFQLFIDTRVSRYDQFKISAGCRALPQGLNVTGADLGRVYIYIHTDNIAYAA